MFPVCLHQVVTDQRLPAWPAFACFPADCPDLILSPSSSKTLFLFSFFCCWCSAFAYIHPANPALWDVFDCIVPSHLQKCKVVPLRSTLRSVPLWKRGPLKITPTQLQKILMPNISSIKFLVVVVRHGWRRWALLRVPQQVIYVLSVC